MKTEKYHAAAANHASEELSDPFTAPVWFWVVLIGFIVTWLVLVPIAWVYYARLRSKNSKMIGTSLALAICSFIIPLFGIGPPIIYSQA